MILQAFSQRLREDYSQEIPPEAVLHRWLCDILAQAPETGDHVAQVIHTEITQVDDEPEVCFEGRSQSGRRLLKSLYEYCDSYHRWQFSRWLHHIQASDFPIP